MPIIYYGGVYMSGILDYIDWRGDLTFKDSPFNDIDNLIFTQLSFIDFESIVPGIDSSGCIRLKDAADEFFAARDGNKIEMGVLVPNDIVKLFKKMSEAPRYQELLLKKYINKIDYEKQQQFAALSIVINEDLMYIAFRGTDDTIVGWKEDFNMGFMSAVPSQLDAVKYVSKSCADNSCKIIIGGHSKGGNLSVYSAIYSEKAVKDRIVKVYNNDGPGFSRKVIDLDEYTEVADRIETIIPESSVVGIMLEHDEKFTIVKSTQKGLLQHDAFSWEVLGKNFVLAEERTKYSEISDAALKTWLSEMDTEERILFVDTLFDILQSTDAKTLLDLNANKLETATALLKTIKNLDDDKKAGMSKILGALFKDNVMAAVNTMLKPKEEKKKHLSKKRGYAVVNRKKGSKK